MDKGNIWYYPDNVKRWAGNNLRGTVYDGTQETPGGILETWFTPYVEHLQHYFSANGFTMTPAQMFKSEYGFPFLPVVAAQYKDEARDLIRLAPGFFEWLDTEAAV